MRRWPRLEQVLHDESGAFGVVAGHGVVGRRAIVAAEHDHGHPRRETFEPLGRDEGRDRDDAVDLPVGEGADGADALLAVDVRGRDDELVVGALQRGRRARDDLREERVADVGHLDAEREARAAHGPRRDARAVVEGVDRGGHALAHRGAHAVGVADHLGDRCA